MALLFMFPWTGSTKYTIWSLVIYQSILSYNLEFFNILY
jgi:hypothetical protein